MFPAQTNSVNSLGKFSNESIKFLQQLIEITLGWILFKQDNLLSEQYNFLNYSGNIGNFSKSQLEQFNLFNVPGNSLIKTNFFELAQ